MEGAASGGFGLLHERFQEEVHEFDDQAGGGKSFFDIVALEIDVGIDFVGDAVVALISFEADVVSGGADPQHLAVDGEGGFPDAEMIA